MSAIRLGAMTLLAVTVCWGGQANAGEGASFDLKPMRLEVAVHVGVLTAPLNHAQYVPSEGSWAELNAGVPLGLKAAFFPLRSLGLELEGEYGLTSTADDTSASILGLRAHLIAQRGGKVSAFALAGVGALMVRSDVLGNDDDPEFHWGVGIKYYAHELATVRVEVRHIVTEGEERASLRNELASYFEFLVGVGIPLLGG
jgi:hypothetical protein